MSKHLIDLKNITKTYDDTDVLKDINLYIRDGEFLTLLGPSGCGKTTMLRLIAGFTLPDNGQILVDGKDISGVPPYRRQVNTVFQKYALFPHLNVFDNIAFGLKIQKLPKDEIESRVNEMMELVNLAGYGSRYIDQLSGGQQQRVAIARALVNRPRVLLLDEPLSNLDARLRLQTREELKRIQQKTKITTIFVTHDQEEAMSISDMIIVMESGVIQQIGRPQEVYDQPVNMFVAKFLGTPPINMFTGSVRGGRLFIGENDVLPAVGTPDGEYNIGIRPEGFIPEENGPLCCAFRRIEVMGRDTSVIFSHPAAEADTVRAIISSANKPDGASGKIRFALRPDKVFLFDKTDGKRIAFRAE